MTKTQPTITRTTNPNGTYRYELDGEVVTKASRRLYTHASVYVCTTPSEWDVKCGRDAGAVTAFLHSREDLAVKGNPNMNGVPGWAKAPGAVAIVEA